MATSAKNYEDSKCSWGYATVCEDCIKNRNAPSYINTQKEVIGFPLYERCEVCGDRVKREQT
jgi:hypothetical protein